MFSLGATRSPGTATFYGPLATHEDQAVEPEARAHWLKPSMKASINGDLFELDEMTHAVFAGESRRRNSRGEGSETWLWVKTPYSEHPNPH